MPLRTALVSLVSFAALQIACGGAIPLGRSCTEIGCTDQASLLLQTADGTLPDGTYEFQFTVEGQTRECKLRIPADLPASGSVGQATCTDGLALYVSPEATCTEQRTEDAVTQSCTPIPGKWRLEAAFPGTPSRFEVAIQRDAQPIAKEARDFDYRTHTPNGADCPPVCRQASDTVTFPAAP